MHIQRALLNRHQQVASRCFTCWRVVVQRERQSDGSAPKLEYFNELSRQPEVPERNAVA